MPSPNARNSAASAPQFSESTALAACDVGLRARRLSMLALVCSTAFTLAACGGGAGGATSNATETAQSIGGGVVVVNPPAASPAVNPPASPPADPPASAPVAPPPVPPAATPPIEPAAVLPTPSPVPVPVSPAPPAPPPASDPGATPQGLTGSNAIGSTARQLLDPARGLVLGQPTAGEDWNRAAALVSQLASWRSFVASRRTTVDSWRAQPRERADMVAGYMHDYIDPASGVPLSWTLASPEPAATGSDAQVRLHQAWVFYVRGYNVRMLGEAVRIFRASGDTAYRDWAAEQLDFYAQNYSRWPLRTVNGRGRMFRTGLDEATASFTLVDAARLLAPFVPAARAEAWKRDLFLPMAENLKTTGSPLTNIGLWQAAAVTRIGLRYGDESLVQWGLNSATGTRATLARSLTADNLWDEGSFTYNAYVIDALYSLSLAAALEGRAALVAPEREAMGRLVMAPLDYRFDNGSLPTPGDATTALAAVDARHQASLYRVLPTWWGVQRTGNAASWDTLVDPPPALPASPSLPVVQTRQFPSVRMAVLRAGAWQTFVHFGQAVANHAQEEALSYELHEGTQPVSTDPGTVSYGSPFHTEYFSRGASHNVPLIDGLGQQAWAPGTVDLWDASGSTIQVSHAQYRSGVAATRRLEQRSSGLVETTQLRANDLRARRLGVAFHTGCTVAAASGLAPATGAQPPRSNATAYWTGLAAWRASGPWAVQLSCGDRLYRYEVAGPAGQTVFIGSAPTTPLPGSRSVMYYETTAAQAEFRATVTRVR